MSGPGALAVASITTQRHSPALSGAMSPAADPLLAAGAPACAHTKGARPQRTRLKWGWVLLCAVLPCQGALAEQFVVAAPDAGARRFGSDIIVLPNGNYLVTDPDWSAGVGADLAGAVYLYRSDGQLLSRLAGGGAGDRVGSGGIVVLANGSFVVRSPAWRASALLPDAGAVSWGDADTGFGPEATVDALNSLVGGSSGDRVGATALVALSDGSFVVGSGDWDNPGVAVDAGAVTWCAADVSCVGAVTGGNSLVGAGSNDRVGDLTVAGRPGVVALASGHFVVAAPRWDAGALVDAGAVTWANGDGSTVGPVSAANSLTGTRAGDYVGSEVRALANGHYVVLSPNWDSAAAANVGAATWADGTVATVASVDPSNSVVGSQNADLVGYLAAALANGNYVVASPFWDDGTVRNVGATTWRDGSGPAPGVVGADNSLVGVHADDNVGYFTTIGIAPLGVVELSNGNHVVASPGWDLDDTIKNVGAATWVDAAGGVVGPVTTQNSLVGASTGDAIAQYIVPLAGGNYVVASPFWSDDRGAATFGNGLGGSVGTVDAGNSLVGTQPDDFISASGVYRLQGGDYAVANSRWSNADVLRVGAITRGSGASGIAGEVSPQNSVVGTLQNDQVGAGGVVPLPDGGYLAQSTLASGVGAITRIDASASPHASLVLASNSLVGKSEDDRIGSPGASVQADAMIVLHTANVAANGAGAITLFDPQDDFVGGIDEQVTVRSAVANGGGNQLNFAHLASSSELLVGDPAANRLVRVRSNLLFSDGFESAQP